MKIEIVRTDTSGKFMDPILGEVRGSWSPFTKVLRIADKGIYPHSHIDMEAFIHELVHTKQSPTFGFGVDRIRGEIEATIVASRIMGANTKSRLLKLRRDLRKRYGVSYRKFDSILLGTVL